MYRSDTTCSWSKQVRASCGWVDGCETLQRRAGCRTGPPTLVHTHGTSTGILYRRSYRHAVYYCTTDAQHGAGLETPATFGQLKRQLGPAGTHTGAFKLSCCFCCCMSDTQNCTSCLPDRKSAPLHVLHLSLLITGRRTDKSTTKERYDHNSVTFMWERFFLVANQLFLVI